MNWNCDFVFSDDDKRTSDEMSAPVTMGALSSLIVSVMNTIHRFR